MAVITISRQFGAGGRTLGRMLADRLGYTFADQQIITKIAEAAQVTPMWVDTIEKEAGTLISKVIHQLVSRSLMERILKDDSGYIDEQLYLDYLVVIIAQLAEEGNVVILGRGSQYILRDHPDAYHVLLINEFEKRVAFMRQHYNLSEKDALKAVKEEDKRRLNLFHRIGKTDYDDPALYHLTLNMDKITMATTLDMIYNLLPPK